MSFFQQRPLVATVKSDKRDGTTTNNPYVAFRRRTEKMQTRKVLLIICDYGKLSKSCLNILVTNPDVRYLSVFR